MAKKPKYGAGPAPAAGQSVAAPAPPRPPEPVEPPPGADGTGRPAGSQAGAGGAPIRDLFNQMGGKKGAGMDFSAFKDWYKQQSQALGGDLGEFIQTSDLKSGRLQGATYGPGATFTAGSDIENFLQPSYLNEAGELQTLNRQLGTDWETLAELQNAYALPAGMAGVTQWNENLSGGRGHLPPHLLDVASQDIRYEPRAWEQFYNAMMQSDKPKERLAAQQALVPEWAGAVDEALQGQVDINRPGQTGIPFGFELMMDPNINLGGGEEGLWQGEYPGALAALHGFQQGEGAFLKGLSMEELMRDIWPLAQAQFHQPAGAPAPFEAGLSFGSPVWDNATGRYIQSPMMGYSDEATPDPDLVRLEGFAGRSATEQELAGPQGLAGGLYNRWAAHGMPGTSDYDAGSYGATLMGGEPTFDLEDIGFGAGSNDPRLAALAQRHGQGYWQNPIYAPWQELPEDVRRRFQRLINSPLGSGGASTLTEGY